MLQRLPPVMAPDKEGYFNQRAQAQSDKILASMELNLHGRVSEALRYQIDGRPSQADGVYDPHRW